MFNSSDNQGSKLTFCIHALQRLLLQQMDFCVLLAVGDMARIHIFNL